MASDTVNDPRQLIETIRSRAADMPSPDPGAVALCRQRWANLAMPPGGLGLWQEQITRMAGMTGHTVPAVRQPAMLLFAADHGVTAQGVTAYATEVTEQVAAAAAMGFSLSGTLARHQGVLLRVVDVGVARPVRHPEVAVNPIARGTRDLAMEPAMDLEQAVRAVYAGLCQVDRLPPGIDLLVLGEVGMGNTTAAAAIASALLPLDPDAAAGFGTGVSEAGRARKVRAITSARERLALSAPSAWTTLAELGGFEIGALAGAIIAAAQRRLPVLLDGLVTGAAALWASQLNPLVADYLVAGMVSPEPAHQPILHTLGLTPLSAWGVRTGEGAGALMVLPALRAALTAFAESATFADARVTNPHPLEVSTTTPPLLAGRPTSPDFSPDETRAVYKAIATRRDIRIYLPDPVPETVLARILHAGHLAPSVGFMQPWDFLVIDDDSLHAALAAIVECERVRAAASFRNLRRDHYLRLKVEGLRDAPITICVTNNPRRGGPAVLGRNTIPETDLMSTACAIQNMWLAARAESIGLGWVSIYPKSEVRELLAMPEHVDPVALLTLGYTPHFPPGPVLEQAGWRGRRPEPHAIHRNRWQPRMDADS
ncbi:MAG: 5,6-dimethylbenzimidazole synthase [Thermaerobacter sp.]|nr:5,6-dimethylbenzimidazole synthase [Thermaerobacter sp.]